MRTDALEPANTTRRSSSQLTFGCPTPAYQTPPGTPQKLKTKRKQKLDPADDKEDIQTHPVE